MKFGNHLCRMLQAARFDAVPDGKECECMASSAQRCVTVRMQAACMRFVMHAGGTFAAGKASLSGVLPLINIPVLPRNSPQERLVAGFPTIRNPSPITPLEALSPPSASPPPTVS